VHRPRFAQYRAAGFDASSIRRVLVMPLTNESPYPLAADELRTALVAELQQGGRLDVIVSPPHTPEIASAAVRLQGQFDENTLVSLGNAFQADAVLCGAVTHYHPYTPPRVGLSLRLISTAESVVVASIDGVWDARDADVTTAARTYYAAEIADERNVACCDAVLRSPRLYHKFVSSDVARAMLAALNTPPPVPPTEIAPAHN
jgi:hypothetical protein